MKPEARYLTARQAAQALRVTLPTLYAYASRGQLQSEAVPGRPRERRYYREDIERLQERKEARRDPAKAAARGLHWGSPVLESGITLIQNGALYYRGRDALKLAGAASLEQVAELLWGEAGGAGRLFEQPVPLDARQLARLRSCAAGSLTRMQMALPLAAASDPAAHDLRLASVRKTGARIVRLFAALIAGREPNLPVHETLAAAWGQGQAIADAARAALVLSADHELNASAFTARCAASAGASPYDVVSAALATLRGSRHGGASERVTALFAEAGSAAGARPAAVNRMRRGEELPGFGHPLYPGGDPRAALLLRIAQAGGNPAEWRLARSLWKAGSNLLQEEPNLDFALAALARVYRLPVGAPLMLFALGRTAGWIAHALEQYATGALIRPRARYTGPPPEEPGLEPSARN